MYQVHDSTNDGTATQIGTGSIHLATFQAYNNDAAKRFVQFFNAVPGDVTVGTTTPLFHLVLPPSGGNTLEVPRNLRTFSTACSYAVTTARGGATGPTVDTDILAVY